MWLIGLGEIVVASELGKLGDQPSEGPHQLSAALLASAGVHFGAESVDLGLDIEQDIEALHRLQCDRV